MKNVLALAALLVFATNVSAVDIKETRKAMAEELNSTVTTLKDFFRPVDSDLKTAKQESLELYKDAKRLKENSEVSESNPTALEHARGGTILDCDARNQELNWTGSNWECQEVQYIADCKPSEGEEKVDDGKGGSTCVLKGSYANKSLGWGVCNDSKGEKETQVGCMFTKTSDNKSYQVNSNLCSNNIDRFKQPCGTNGGSSSCKCPDGYFYDYSGGSAICKQKFAVSITSMSNSTYSKTSLSTDGKLSFRLYSPDGACRHNKAVVKLNIDKDRLTKVTIPSIFMARGAWVWVNGKLLRKRLYGIAGASSKPTGSGVGDLGFENVYPGTGRIKYESSNRNGSSTSWRVPHGKTMCGRPYPSNGTFGVKGSNCVFTCDTKNASDRGASNIDIPLSYLNDGANEFIFENVGSNGTLLQGSVVFEETESSSSVPLPECKI